MSFGSLSLLALDLRLIKNGSFANDGGREQQFCDSLWLLQSLDYVRTKISLAEVKYDTTPYVVLSSHNPSITINIRVCTIFPSRKIYLSLKHAVSSSRLFDLIKFTHANPIHSLITHGTIIIRIGEFREISYAKLCFLFFFGVTYISR